MDRARAALRRYELSISGVRETGRYLGSGMRGAIVEIEYEGFPGRYAAKKIRLPPIIDIESDGPVWHTQIQEGRFKECLLHSQLDHPNIVQFIGVYYEPGANVPVLVTELLSTSLDSLLQDRSAWGTVPNETKYSILEDVALGLQYLHERPQPIVHRLLSESTVLLTENMRAKVCGLARLDSEDDNGTELDIFCYGVLMLHVLARTLPQSGPATYAYHGTTEVERRQRYLSRCLSQLGPDHPLKNLIVRCLANHSAQRPTISQVVTHLREASGM